MEAKLMDKDGNNLDLLLKSGKRVTIKLTTLSEGDQEYVKQAKPGGDPQILAKTVVARSSESKAVTDHRIVEVQVKKVAGRSYKLKIIWLGPLDKTVGVHASETVDITENRTVIFETTYDKSYREVHTQYKGFAVAISEETDRGEKIVAKQASQKPFERFLDQ